MFPSMSAALPSSCAADAFLNIIISCKGGLILKKRPIKILTVSFIMLLLSVFPAFSAEVLENFDAAIKINEDSSLSVTENITAKVENINISRGIIRAFPVEYEDKNGRSVTVGFDVEDVLLDGAPVPWEVSDSGRYKALRIGDPSKIIPRGLHTFTIKYRTTRQIGFYENYDELYWNVTGNQWTFPIIHSTVKVSLPNLPYGEGFSSAEWYVGAYGEKGSPSDAKLGKSRSISITRPLMPGEGYTVVYTWPKGIVTPPPPPREDNEKAHVIIGALTLISMAGWFAFAWRKWGKDPSRKAVIPIFCPPDGESPSFLRFARDLKSDKTAFTAEILNLAVKGALTIEEEKGEDGFFSKGKSTFILHAKDKSPEKLKPEEDVVMMHLFPGEADTLVLTNDSAEQISDALAGLRGVMRRRTKELYSDARTEFNNKTNIKFSDFEIGWIGWMASFNGRFFDGGYSGTVGKRDYINEQIRNTENQIPLIKGAVFESGDYRETSMFYPDNSIIYCDIPYKGTKQYATSKSFDYDSFYNWCRNMKHFGHRVFISEYDAPNDFTCVWEKEVTNSMNSTITYRPTERLYTI